MKSKTIILSQEKSNGRGILTLYMEDELLKAKLRLYDIPQLSPHCKLGIYHNKEVSSANLIYKFGQYSTSFVGNFNMDNDFYTAIVDTGNNNAVVLAGGTYAGYYFNDNSVFNNLNDSNNITNSSFEEEPEQYISSEDTNKQLNNTQLKMENTTASECLQDCSKCKYKEYFYSNNPLPNLINQQASQPNPIKEEPEQKLSTSVLENLIPQFDYILSHYPENSELNSLIENSKFVTIEGNVDSYSLGAIYLENKLKYICYAVKCNYNTPAPEELGKFYQWLPINSEDPLSEGYYIVYQDALDLKIIEV